MHKIRGWTSASRRWLRGIRPKRSELRGELLAGLPGAISSVPDGMAAAVLAGVNPVQGLYASFAGPVAGGLTSSTRLMVITTTSAAALAAGSALQGVPADDRPAAIPLLVIMVGIVLVAAGVAHLGRYTRFVSYSVMIGFLTGIAVNIVCGQLSDLTGAPAHGSFPLAKAVSILAHPGSIDIASLLAGLGALALLVVLTRTRVALFSTLIALVIPTVVVILAAATSVARVGDVGGIPGGIPIPRLPEFHYMSFSLIAGAFAIAAIVLVQGAGVAEAAPNTDGSPSSPNQDIIAQGAGNLAAGFFRGMAVGGSVGQTALNVSSGGRTRWAAIWSGVWMLVILAIFSGLVAKIAMPTLAAILIFAGIGSIRPGEITSILRTGRISQVVVITTFAATLSWCACRPGRFQVVQFLCLFGGHQADIHEVERADEAVADAEPACPDDGVPERHGPVVLQEHQRGRGVIRNLLQHIPAVLLAEDLHAAGGGHLLGAFHRTRFGPLLTGDAEPDQGADLAAELDRLALGKVAEVLHFYLSQGVLVDRQGVDDADCVAFAKSFELGDDLAVEVRILESEHNELYRPNRHIHAPFA